MEDGYGRRPLAGWYWISAIASLLLMLLALARAAIHFTMDPATLPLDERVQYEAVPLWMMLAFALSGLMGAIGGIMLVLRRRAAEPLLAVAFLAMAVWFLGLFVNPLRELLSTGQIAAGLGIVAIVWTIFWFARHSRQRGWLR